VVAAAAVAGPILGMLAAVVTPGRLEETIRPIENPFGRPGVVGTVAAVVGLIGLGLWMASMLAALVSRVAVAVLRYRLWDLDRLVSRTVTYAAFTALLLIPYLLVLPAATRLAGNSGSLAVAAAALFQPLRRRVQALVDRRFNRRRYDAARTLEGFATRLRDQVALGALHAELLGVVDQTMQPTHAWLWLRPPARQVPTGG
jgi:hypothetical protein